MLALSFNMFRCVFLAYLWCFLWGNVPFGLNEPSLHVDLAPPIHGCPPQRLHFTLESHLVGQTFQLLLCEKVVKRIIAPSVPMVFRREQTWFGPSSVLFGVVAHLREVAIGVVSEQDVTSMWEKQRSELGEDRRVK